jgi:hypothetical protein
MALNTYQDAKGIIDSEWETLKESAYPEDFISEYADSLVPIYYNGILEEWSSLPSEYEDSWKGYGIDENTTIYTLMSIDLLNYYRDLLTRAYNEYRQDKEND